MKTWMLQIKDKVGAVNIALISAVIISCFSFKFSAQNMQGLTTIGDGVQTCFSRVQQSFTARLLGQGGSGYLASDFLVTTENCFGDLVSEFGDKFKNINENGYKQLNALASNTHWLHEKIDPSKATELSGLTIKGINGRFRKLETNKDQVLSLIDSQKINLENSVYTWSFIFYMCLLGIIGIFARNFYLNKKNDEERDFIENRADELIKTEFEKNKTKGLLEDILRRENYQRSSQLLSRFQIELERGVANSMVTPEEDIPQELTLNAAELERELTMFDPVVVGHTNENLVEINGKKKYQVATESENPNLESVHLASLMTKVVDVLSSKLFTQGIIIDPVIDEDLFVLANKESLEQVLYHVVSNSIQACSTVLEKKVIKINSKKLGNTALLSFEDSGTGFSSSFLKNQAGLNSEVPTLGIGLSICQEFMEEFGGKVNFENITNDMELVVGGKVQLVFRSAEKPAQLPIEDAPKAKTVSVKKGTKKEILRQFNQPSGNA